MIITPSAILVYRELEAEVGAGRRTTSTSKQTMVLCVVIGCSKRSGRDKDVSFYRIPKVIAHRGKQEYELTKKRRAGFLAAISRDTKGTSVLENMLNV